MAALADVAGAGLSSVAAGGAVVAGGAAVVSGFAGVFALSPPHPMATTAKTAGRAKVNSLRELMMRFGECMTFGVGRCRAERKYVAPA